MSRFKILITLLVALFAGQAMAQNTNFSATVRNNVGAVVPNGVLSFVLKNCGVGAALNTTFAISANGAGLATGSFTRNGALGCSGTDYYQVTLKDATAHLMWIRPYSFTLASGDLNTPLTVLPQTAANVAALDSNTVHKTGDETIAGNKTFSGTVSAGATVQLGPCSGVDDTATLQAALNSYNHVRLAANTNCVLFNTLTVPSNTWFDLNGGTLSAQPGLAVPMIQNYAAANLNRTVSDGAGTGAGYTVTSSTAAFTSTDVGRSITLWGAGSPMRTPTSPPWVVANPAAPDLYAHITAVNSASSVTIDMPLYVTVSGQVLKIYTTRDINIKVSDGMIARGTAPGGAGSLYNTTNWRRADNLNFENLFITSSGHTAGGAYALSMADTTHVRGRGIRCKTFSDCWHITGPGSDIVARDLSGHSGDDFTVITTRDWAGPWNLDPLGEVYGPVTNITVDGVTASSGTGLVRLECETGAPITNVTLRNYVADAASGGFMISNGGMFSPTGTGCNIDQLTIDGISGNFVATPRSPALISLWAYAMGDITIRNLKLAATTEPKIVDAGSQAASGSTLQRLNLDNFGVQWSTTAVGQTLSLSASLATSVVRVNNFDIGWNAPNLSQDLTSTPVSVVGGGSIGALQMSHIRLSAVTGVYGAVCGVGNIGSLLIDGVQATFATVGGGSVANIGTGAPYFAISNVWGYNLGTAVNFLTGSYGTVYGELSNITLNTGRVANLAGSGTLNLLVNNVVDLGVSAGLIYTNGINVNVSGSGVVCPSCAFGFFRAGSEILHSRNEDWPSDLSILAQTSGDKALNYVNSNGPGVPMMSDGTWWRPMNGGFHAVTGNIGGSSVAAGACATGTVTVNGAKVGMTAQAGWNNLTGPGANFIVSAYVSAANIATVNVCNPTSGALTPSTIWYSVTVN